MTPLYIWHCQLGRTGSRGVYEC